MVRVILKSDHLGSQKGTIHFFNDAQIIVLVPYTKVIDSTLYQAIRRLKVVQVDYSKLFYKE